MRTLINVTAKQIAEAIRDNTQNMEARLVTRNKFNQEFLVKLVRTTLCSEPLEEGRTVSVFISTPQINTDNGECNELPEYLPEDDEPEAEREGVVSLFTGLRQSASTLYKSTAEFLHNSFYW